MNNTLLYSTKELSMLHANKQAQRHLDVACHQIDQEKTYIVNDWNNRIKTFISQKKKVMPKGWDPNKYRPSAVWSSTPRTFNSGPFTGEYGAPTLYSPRIPRTWQLQASYIKLADGRMIQRPLEKKSTALDTHRRVVSAPGLRPRQIISPRPPSVRARKSFLVTQLEMEDELDQKQDEVYYNSPNTLTVPNMNRYRQRPLSATDQNPEQLHARPRSGRVVQRPRSSIVLQSSDDPYS